MKGLYQKMGKTCVDSLVNDRLLVAMLWQMLFANVLTAVDSLS